MKSILYFIILLLINIGAFINYANSEVSINKKLKNNKEISSTKNHDDLTDYVTSMFMGAIEQLQLYPSENPIEEHYSVLGLKKADNKIIRDNHQKYKHVYMVKKSKYTILVAIGLYNDIFTIAVHSNEFDLNNFMKNIREMTSVKSIKNETYLGKTINYYLLMDNNTNKMYGLLMTQTGNARLIKGTYTISFIGKKSMDKVLLNSDIERDKNKKSSTPDDRMEPDNICDKKIENISICKDAEDMAHWMNQSFPMKATDIATITHAGSEKNIVNIYGIVDKDYQQITNELGKTYDQYLEKMMAKKFCKSKILRQSISAGVLVKYHYTYKDGIKRIYEISNCESNNEIK